MLLSPLDTRTTAQRLAENMRDMATRHNYYRTQDGQSRCVYCDQPKDDTTECPQLVEMREQAVRFLASRKQG